MAPVVFRTAHPEAKPAVAVTPANWRKSRRLMTIVESAGRSTVTNRGPHRQRFCLQFLRSANNVSGHAQNGYTKKLLHPEQNQCFQISVLITA